MRNINIVILAGGYGKRFRDHGYQDPKPFIELYKNSPMIKEVIKNLKGTKHSAEYRFIIVTQAKFLEEYGKILNKILSEENVNYCIRTEDGNIQGAAFGALTVKDLIENDEELILTDVDHLTFDKDHIYNGVQFFRDNNADGGLWVFHATDPKFSFVKLDDNTNIVDVAEKSPISEIANTGSYYWKKGKDFIKYTKEMVNRKEKVLGEYYLAPVYKFALIDGLTIKPFFVNRFYSLGTPQLMNLFLERFPKL